jgi:hypothetical protein
MGNNVGSAHLHRFASTICLALASWRSKKQPPAGILRRNGQFTAIDQEKGIRGSGIGRGS